MKDTLNGVAALLRTSLGPHWQHLHPDIRARFTLAPGATRQRFTGTMTHIERSPLGWLIARLITFVHVLPSVRARDVPFEFNLTATANGGWIKQRLYHFSDGPFEFRSVMRVEPTGELIENFPVREISEDKISSDDGRAINHDLLMFIPPFQGQKIIKN